MTNISKPLYVYLQRPDNGEWVTVGRYKAGLPGEGLFRYAPSYIDAGLTWSIDPFHLPLERIRPDLTRRCQSGRKRSKGAMHAGWPRAAPARLPVAAPVPAR